MYRKAFTSLAALPCEICFRRRRPCIIDSEGFRGPASDITTKRPPRKVWGLLLAVAVNPEFEATMEDVGGLRAAAEARTTPVVAAHKKLPPTISLSVWISRSPIPAPLLWGALLFGDDSSLGLERLLGMGSFPLRWRLLMITCIDMIGMNYPVKVASVAMIIPLLTPYARDLGASTTLLGLMGSLFGSVQLFSSPVLGFLSDMYPRRTVLMICLLAGSVGYAIIPLVPSVPILIMSRIITGLFRQTLTIMKAWISDITKPIERRQQLSFFYASTAMAFAIAPALGGMLAEDYGYRVPFTVATGILLFNVLLVRTTLPSDSKLGNSESAVEKSKDFRTSNVSPNEGDVASKDKKCRKSSKLTFASLRPKVQKLMIVRLVIGGGVMLFRSNLFFMLELQHDDFGLSAKGKVISFFAVVGLVAQVVLSQLDTSGWCEMRVACYSSVIIAIGQLIAAKSNHIVVFLIALALVSVGSAVLKVFMTTALSTAAGELSYGEVLGVAGSVFSVSRAAAPLISGVLAQYVGSGAPTFVASFFMMMAAAALYSLQGDSSISQVSNRQHDKIASSHLKNE
eukprot:jgi/Bigna1/74965/fgenesh1_pg.32_\